MTTINYDIDFNNGAPVATTPSAIVSQYDDIIFQTRLINFSNVLNVRMTVTLPTGDSKSVYMIQDNNYPSTYFIYLVDLFNGLTISNLQQVQVKFDVITSTLSYSTVTDYFNLYNTSESTYYDPSDISALFTAYSRIQKQIADLNARLNELEGD